VTKKKEHPKEARGPDKAERLRRWVARPPAAPLAPALAAATPETARLAAEAGATLPPPVAERPAKLSSRESPVKLQQASTAAPVAAAPPPGLSPEEADHIAGVGLGMLDTGLQMIDGKVARPGGGKLPEGYSLTPEEAARGRRALSQLLQSSDAGRALAWLGPVGEFLDKHGPLLMFLWWGGVVAWTRLLVYRERKEREEHERQQKKGLRVRVGDGASGAGARGLNSELHAARPGVGLPTSPGAGGGPGSASEAGADGEVGFGPEPDDVEESEDGTGL
jgi:phage-related protein